MSHAASPPDRAEPEVPVRLVLVAVCSVLFLASLGQTVVSTAMPAIANDLNGLDRITWLLTAYLLASTIGAPICGKLGDLFGRKVVMQGGILVFLLGSVIAGVASDMATVILGRGVQGFGGGGLIVVAMAVVADVLPARERGKAQALLASMFGISTVIGPLVGGFLVEQLNWHWIFFVNLPVGAVALVILAVVLKPAPPRAARSMDYAGAGLLALTLAASVLAVNLGGTALGWDSPALLVLMALAVLGAVGFVWAERRAEDPVLPLTLFSNRNFLVVNATGFMVGIGMFGTIAFVPVYLQLVKGIGPTGSGLFLGAMVGGLLSASTLSGQAMSRTGRYRIYPILSTALLTLGMLLLATLGRETPLWLVAVFLLIVGLGIGPVLSIGVAAVQNSIPLSMLGVGTASTNMFRMIGGAVGTAGFGALFAAGMARHVSALLPGTEGTAPRALTPEMVAALPPEVQLRVQEGISAALSPIFLAGAMLAALACLASLRMIELPLSAGGRPETEGRTAPAE
ncbi:MAG: MFS transporter [Paracoccaceae bacterium]